MKNRKRIKQLFLLIFLLAFAFVGGGQSFADNQTPVETAEFLVREDGVPIMDIEGIGETEHPAWIATYALAYMGAESYYEVDMEPSEVFASNCIDWLKENITKENGLSGWAYQFDSTYNDITIRAPWYSAFGQACGIEALVRWYEMTGDTYALNLAKECAEMLFVPIKDGGILYSRDEDIWFEEIPSQEQEPSHILNGHMRACIALGLLYDQTGDETYLDWYQRGITTLEKWLPLYDSGYWLRYDLNPKKAGLLFRFNNPYGDLLPELAIDEIRLTDPLTGESISIDAGAAPADMDPASGSYLAGLDWQMESLPDGHTVRRLVASLPESDYGVGSAKPNSYFYLDLPSRWTDNLRTDWYELTVVYLDEAPSDVCVEMRAISPDEEFVELRDGDLLLTGSGEWREWTVPLRPTDLGWPVGSVYAIKHIQYLQVLAERSPELSSWVSTAQGYWNAALLKLDPSAVLGKMNNVDGDSPEQITQSMILPLCSTDKDNVALQHYADEDSVLFQFLDAVLPSSGTKGYYSPYLIAEQALGEAWALETFRGSGDPKDISDEYPYYGEYDWILAGETTTQAPPEPAYKWLRDHAVSAGDGFVWHMDADNAYNDLEQKAGWQSAFWQRYIIDAFAAIDDEEMIKKAAYAYGVPTDEGGLCSIERDGTLWFEEVPNNSHILNADLASIVALQEVNEQYPDNRVSELYEIALHSLRENLYRFDTGYWTKYDANPQKNILFELEWNRSSNSPIIDTIFLYTPDTGNATVLDVGENGDTEGNCHISGTRWQSPKIEDWRLARSFGAAGEGDEANGVAAYFTMSLPETEQEDYFQTLCHYFLIRYKDTASGQLSILRQSIAEGSGLVMLPLREATINCTGDGEWKVAVIALRPQDLGWYMGPDYQAYHNEQLGLIAEQTQDWYFKQTVERWSYYLNEQQAFDLRQCSIEGSNRAIFVETEKEAYIPKTTWREKELNGSEETCLLSLASCSERLNKTDLTSFFSGEKDSLILDPGDSLLVELNGAHWLSEARISLDEGGLLDMKITDINQQKAFYKARIRHTDTISFAPVQLCAYLQIRCPEDADKPAVVKSIKLTGIPTIYEQLLREDPEDPIVLDGSDQKNPLHIYRIPLRQSVYRLADCLLEGDTNLTPHQKMMVFMDYISDWYVGLDNGIHYLAFHAYIESCGGFSNVLAGLAATQGFSARIVNLCNYPRSYGHTVCEVFYDEAWHLYDPTYGAYYTNTPTDAVSPNVLSFDDLVQGFGNRKGVTCVVTTPQRLISTNSFSFLGPRIYERAEPKGPIGPDRPMTYPLHMDLLEGRLTEEDFGTERQGIHYLGAANINSSQLWTITGLEAGKTYEFVVTGDWLGGEVLEPFFAYSTAENAKILKDESHYFDVDDPGSMEWKIEFVPESDNAHILLTHDYLGPLFRYVRFSSFEIHEKN